MNKTERDMIKQKAQSNQRQYLESILDMSQKQTIGKKLDNFNNKFKRFLRCEYGSNNSLKQIPHLSALIWSIQDYQ